MISGGNMSLKLLKIPFKNLIFLFILVISSSIISVYPINLIMGIIDATKAINKDVSISIIMKLGFVYLLLQIINSFLISLIKYLATNYQINLEANLQRGIFEKLTKINLDFFSKKDTSSFSNLIIRDVDFIGKNSLEPYTELIRAVTSFIFGVIFMWRINPLLTSFVIPLGISSSLIIRKVSRQSEANISIHRNNSDKMIKVFNEGILGILPIRLHNHIIDYSKIIETSIFDLKNSLIVQRNLEIKSNFIAQLFFMSSIGIILIISALLVVNNYLTLGGLTAILMYNHMLVDPLLSVIDLNPKFIQLKVSTQRVSNIFDEPSITQKSATEIDEIVTENLTYKINNKSVIENLNLHVDKKSSLAIIGKTGVGKSTLTNLLAGLIEPTSGSIHYYNELKEISSNSIPKLSYMMQNEFLFDTTIEKNIRLANPDLTEENYREILDICELIELEKNIKNSSIGEAGAKISGGERKRILIARTIADTNASIFIFDELSSSLDSKTFEKIIERVESILENKIRIYIEHNKLIEQYVDKVILLKN